MKDINPKFSIPHYQNDDDNDVELRNGATACAVVTNVPEIGEEGLFELRNTDVDVNVVKANGQIEPRCSDATRSKPSSPRNVTFEGMEDTLAAEVPKQGSSLSILKPGGDVSEEAPEEKAAEKAVITKEVEAPVVEHLVAKEEPKLPEVADEEPKPNECWDAVEVFPRRDVSEERQEESRTWVAQRWIEKHKCEICRTFFCKRTISLVQEVRTVPIVPPSQLLQRHASYER